MSEFLFFSARNKLAELYEQWAKANNASICSVNLVTFLFSNDLLNIDKVKEFLANENIVSRGIDGILR